VLFDGVKELFFALLTLFAPQSSPLGVELKKDIAYVLSWELLLRRLLPICTGLGHISSL
jgi:hypothetical protein